MKTNQSQKNIPSDWQLTKLANIGVFSKGAGISKEELSEDGHNAIRYGELYTKHDVKINEIYSFISDKIIPLTKKIKYGDILFAGSGETIDEIGKSATYLLKEDCYAGGDTIIFSPKNANSLFLSYFLNFGEGRKRLRELGQGQSVVHIYKSDIEELELYLPSVPEQNRIVSVLETWDKAIENLIKKIEIKKQIKKGLMQDLLTGKKRLSGFKDKWEISSLENIVTILKNGVPKFDGLKKYYSTSAVLNNDKIDLVSYENRQSRADMYPAINDIAIAKMKGTNRCFITNEDFLGSIFSTGFCFLRAKKDINYSFVYYLVSSDKFQYFKDLYSASGIMGGIGNKELLSIEIKTPKDINEQNAIAEILTTADKEITELERKLGIIKDQKKYLLNNLITGAIRTPENLLEKVK